jgi:putative modified peptide
MIAEDQSEAAESSLTDVDLAQLGRELQIDATFRRRFDLDPVAAVEAAGMRKLAVALEREMRELVALAERIANDDGYRADLHRDPVAALVEAGVPAAAAEPLLEALGMPDDVLAKLPEVVAHQYVEPPRKTELLLLLLGSTACATTLRSATHAA